MNAGCGGKKGSSSSSSSERWRRMEESLKRDERAYSSPDISVLAAIFRLEKKRRHGEIPWRCERGGGLIEDRIVK